MMNVEKAPRLLIVAGGTGGHIYPALAVAEVLAQKGVEVLWVGVPNRMEGKIVPQYFPIQYIDMKPLRGRGIKETLKSPWYMWQATKQAKQIIKQFQPDLVLSMGGFACAPVGWAAKQLKIPLIVHEQNAIAGWTNILLSRWAQDILVAFPEPFKQKKKLNCQWVGNPIRKSITDVAARQSSRQPGVPLNILVLGGSQGARYLNQTVSQVLLPFAQAGQINIWHQTGERDLQYVQDIYKPLVDRVTVQPFIADMSKPYTWADLIISRSGALIISEISCFGVPSILVPFPGAVGDHQRYNANFLVSAGSAIMMDQRIATPESWQQCIQRFVDDPNSLTQMQNKALTMRHADARDKVVKVCEAYL